MQDVSFSLRCTNRDSPIEVHASQAYTPKRRIANSDPSFPYSPQRPRLPDILRGGILLMLLLLSQHGLYFWVEVMGCQVGARKCLEEGIEVETGPTKMAAVQSVDG